MFFGVFFFTHFGEKLTEENDLMLADFLSLSLIAIGVFIMVWVIQQ